MLTNLELKMHLTNLFGFSPKDAEDFVEIFLRSMKESGCTEEGDEAILEGGNSVTAFGSVFDQIKNGGIPLVTQDGKEVNSLMIGYEKTDKETLVFYVCPQFTSGIIAGVQEKDGTVILGYSISEEKSLIEALNDLFGKNKEKA